MGGRADGVVVIGAGIAGLAAAIELAASGLAVTLLDRAPVPGGKMRTVSPGERPIDAGPTVLTLLPVFEALFRRAGTTLDRHLLLAPCRVLARHWWPDGSTLDLHASPGRTAEAIGQLAGAAERRGFERFAARAAVVWEALDRSFVAAPKGSVAGLVGRAGVPALLRIGAFSTLAETVATFFADPRLRQLFGRYATYCGTSPFRAPATLMLVAHVESLGVWRVEGGMAALASALAALASGLGVRMRFGCEVASIEASGGRASAVRLRDGERVGAGAVVAAVELGALASGLFGAAARRAVGRLRSPRSLSAVTWALEATVAGGASLGRHNVFFGAGDGRAEFDAIARGHLPDRPTVYLCAQDRTEPDAAPPPGPERFLCLVNAPHDGFPLIPEELARCETTLFETLRRHGVTLSPTAPPIRTDPQRWAALFPGSGGALYGGATEGPWGAFRRPGARSRLRGLYLAGGSVHPGPGVPMAAISGRLAASALMADRASTPRSRRAAISGGTSMRSATTDGTV